MCVRMLVIVMLERCDVLFWYVAEAFQSDCLLEESNLRSPRGCLYGCRKKTQLWLLMYFLFDFSLNSHTPEDSCVLTCNPGCVLRQNCHSLIQIFFFFELCHGSFCYDLYCMKYSFIQEKVSNVTAICLVMYVCSSSIIQK